MVKRAVTRSPADIFSRACLGPGFSGAAGSVGAMTGASTFGGRCWHFLPEASARDGPGGRAAGVQGAPSPSSRHPLFCFQSGAAGASGDGAGARSSAVPSSEGGPAVLQGQVRTTAAGPHCPALCSRAGLGRVAGGQAVKGKWAWGQGPAHPLSRRAGGSCLGALLVCGSSHTCSVLHL